MDPGHGAPPGHPQPTGPAPAERAQPGPQGGGQLAGAARSPLAEQGAPAAEPGSGL